MSKNIYEMLNEVDIDLEELENEDFTDFEKSKIKKNFRKSIKKNKSYKKYIVAASILLVSMCLLNKNVVSYAKELIDDITYSISKVLGIGSDLEEYTNIINKSVSKNGLEVSISEVILNNDEMIFTYIVRSDKKLERIGYPSVDISSISINNKEISGLGGGSGKQIDEYTTKNVLSFTLVGIEEDELKGEVDIRVSFDKATLDNDRVIKGPWNFEFKADGKQLALDTEEIKINKTYELGSGAKLVIDKYTKNDMGEKIYTRIENYDENRYYDLYITGVDDSGIKVRFIMDNSSNIEPILERFDGSLSLDVKNIKLSVYLAETKLDNMPMNSDFELIGEEFVIE
ncbi:MAG: DUF4179 domain-containing protein [Peptostreptococcaceae bacterium]|nr:DUF4179 domain-containing protein [Peptostreptococcaceae bacterium]